MPTWRALRDLFVEKLATYWGKREAVSIFFIAIESVFNITKTKYLIVSGSDVSEKEAQEMNRILERLEQKEPIQYILKEAAFMDLKLEVSPAVLIPRPETEELVSWVLDTFQQEESNIRGLDIGTGSGCIALALKSRLPNLFMEGWDVSLEALKLVKINANYLDLQINLKVVDILHDDYNLGFWDFIVSNPPYIPEKEKNSLKEHVSSKEPDLALFSPDKDPIIFYRRIINLAFQQMKIGGYLFLEGHEDYLNQVMDLIDPKLWEKELRNDINEKPRLIRAKRI